MIYTRNSSTPEGESFNNNMGNTQGRTATKPHKQKPKAQNAPPIPQAPPRYLKKITEHNHIIIDKILNDAREALQQLKNMMDKGNETNQAQGLTAIFRCTSQMLAEMQTHFPDWEEEFICRQHPMLLSAVMDDFHLQLRCLWKSVRQDKLNNLKGLLDSLAMSITNDMDTMGALINKMLPKYKELAENLNAFAEAVRIELAKKNISESKNFQISVIDVVQSKINSYPTSDGDKQIIRTEDAAAFVQNMLSVYIPRKRAKTIPTAEYISNSNDGKIGATVKISFPVNSGKEDAPPTKAVCLNCNRLILLHS